MLNLLKHRTEERAYKSSSGFTIAELGAGLGVFALAASLMAPMAISSATASLTADGETTVTVNNDNGRKPVTTPPVDAVEITVVDATGNEVKTVTVDDPNATSTVISGLNPDSTYTFEVAKVNAAGKSAKATAKLEYKKVGTEDYQVEVTENYTEEKTATVGATPEQVDDTSKPQYKQVDDKTKPVYKQVQESYTVPENRTRTVRQAYQARVATPQYRNTNHTHYRYAWTTQTRYSNHTHRSSYNHRHRSYYSYNHYHRWCYTHTHRWRWYRWGHRHCGGTNHRHGGYRTSYHRHYSSYNHRHRDTVRVRNRMAYNHTHRIHWTTTYSYETRYRNVQENYTVPVTKTRMKTVLDRYRKKSVFTGYAKKTQYRLCYQPRGRNGVTLAQRCEIKSSPATKRLSWIVDKQRKVMETRTKDVFDYVKQTSVKAQPGYVVFKASGMTDGRIFREGTVAAVGTGVTNVSEGSTAKFLRWSGKTFTMNGEQYIKVHRFAVR